MLVVAIPEGRRTRYELTDPRIDHALGDLLDLVLIVDPDCCGGETTRPVETNRAPVTA